MDEEVAEPGEILLNILEEGHCPDCDSRVVHESITGADVYHCERCRKTWGAERETEWSDFV